MGRALKRLVQLRSPKSGQKHVLFGSLGQVGALSGMNASGLSITSAMLLDRPMTSDNPDGLLHGLLIRKILSSADSIESAIDICRMEKNRGAWGMMITSSQAEEATYLEFDGPNVMVERFRECRSAANHSELLGAKAATPDHSIIRGRRLRQMLDANEECSDVFQIASNALLDRFDASRNQVARNKTMNTVCRVDHQASILMAPEKFRAWLAPSDSRFNEIIHDSVPSHFIEIPLDRFFGKISSSKLSVDTTFPSDLHASIVETQTSSKTLDYGSGFVPEMDAQSFCAEHEKCVLQPPDQACTDVCARLVLRMVPQELQYDVQSKTSFAQSRALILGDNEVGRSLRKILQEEGCVTRILASTADIEVTCDSLRNTPIEQHWQHLFIVTAWDDPSETYPRQLKSDREKNAIAVYRMAQAWYQQLPNEKRTEGGWLIVATRLGGDCGLGGQSDQHVSGAQTGLLKAILLERKVMVGSDLNASTIDFEQDAEPEYIVERIREEVRRTNVEREIGYRDGARRVLRMMYSPLKRPVGASESDWRISLSSALGSWIITGGARGVTAEIVKGLGRVMQRVALEAGEPAPGTLHLFGSSPQPEVDPSWLDLDHAQRMELRSQIIREALQRKSNGGTEEKPADAWDRVERGIEIARSLREMERLGVRVRYHQCDVSDRELVQEKLALIRREFGPIVGVVYGAGFEKATRFVNKKLPLVDRTISAKVDGLLTLMDLTRSDPVEHFIGFGSISGRFGAVGQTDYALANEWLCRAIARYRTLRPEVHAVAMDWHSWADVGMAARPETKHAELLSGLRFMPVEEGVAHFLAELHHRTSEREVVITDWRYYMLYFPNHGISEARTSIKSSETPPLPAFRSKMTPQVCQRYVLRFKEYPLREWNQTWNGPTVVIGDNRDADLLQRELERRGASVIRFSLNIGGSETDAEIIERWNRLLEAMWPSHLFLLPSRDLDASLHGGWQPYLARRRSGVILPYRLLQSWVRIAKHRPAPFSGSIVAALDLGGDFGFRNRPSAPEGGALTGILKSIKIEMTKAGWKDLVVKAIDSTLSTHPESLASHLANEALCNDPLVEIAYDQNRRMTPAMQAESLQSYTNPPAWLTRGGDWLAIGGGRGITGAAALQLSKLLGLRMHLVGRKPLIDIPPEWLDLDDEGKKHLKSSVVTESLAQGKSPNERWQQIAQNLEIQGNLREYQRAGAVATYHAIDTSNTEAWDALLSEIRKEFGPIRGVLQGAGIKNSGTIERKTLDALEQMVAAKNDITQLLFELLRAHPLECFIGFGSITGRMGGNGGTDYALGADMICKQVGWFRHYRPEVKSVSFHWHGWGDVGMMMDAKSFGARNISKVSLMPPDEGVRHILAELQAGAPESEVLVTDHTYIKVLENDGIEIPIIESVDSDTYCVRSQCESAARLPLNPSVVEIEQALATEVELNPKHHTFLSEHLFRGTPLMPMVGMIEVIFESACKLGLMEIDSGCELEDFKIIKGLKFLRGAPQRLKTQFQRSSNGYKVRMVRDYVDSHGRLLEKDQPIAVCSFRNREAKIAGEEQCPQQTVWYPVEYPEETNSIYHGKPFRWLSHFSQYEQSVYARLLQPANSDWDRTTSNSWIAPMGAIDGSLFACGISQWLQNPRMITIPSGFTRLELAANAIRHSHFLARVVDRTESPSIASFDVVAWEPNGEIQYRLTNYTGTIITK
jgi:NAD(P)-dependent dehydrogenase (short-subunit alcohol dehydrogenase family)